MNNQKEYLFNGKKQYVMFDLNFLNSDICYWENTVSCPEKIIDLINYLDDDSNSYSKIPKWDIWTASDDLNTKYGAVKMIKSGCKYIDSLNKKIDQNVLYIINSLSMAVEMCFDKYMNEKKLEKSKYNIDLFYLPIKRWDPGSSMGPHTDGGYSFPKLSFTLITYLNDDYLGGEIEFPEHNIVLKPKAGSTIMFPSNFVHNVKPILEGSRYMSTNSVNMI